MKNSSWIAGVVEHVMLLSSSGVVLLGGCATQSGGGDRRDLDRYRHSGSSSQPTTFSAEVLPEKLGAGSHAEGEVVSLEICREVCAAQSGGSMFELMSCEIAPPVAPPAPPPSADDRPSAPPSPSSAPPVATVATDVVPVKVPILCRGIATYFHPAGRADAPLVAITSDADEAEEIAWLDQCAQREAISIEAFRAWAQLLETLGAPRSLIEACERARREEAEHHTLIEALLPSRGRARANRPVPVPLTREKSLAENAIDNAVEGCVNETFGAVIAAWQSRTATAGDVRETLTRIAVDEERHASLSLSIHAFLWTKLDAEGRASVHSAVEAAFEALGAQASRVRANATLGLPSARDAEELLAYAAPIMRARITEFEAAA